MNRSILLLLMAGMIISCKNTSSNSHVTGNLSEQQVGSERNSVVDATIELILEEEISIRAIDVKDSLLWYSGSKGKYGCYNRYTKEFDKGVIHLNEGEELDFRSISAQHNATYVLSAGSPALWYKIATDDSVQLVFSNADERIFFDSMKFWNENEGIAFSDPVGGCFNIVKTYDGGQTFGQLDCVDLPEYVVGEAGFAASNSSISIYNDHVWIATGGAIARIFHSADRGESWEVFNTPIIAGSEMKGIFSIDFYDENLGVAIGGDWNEKTYNDYNKAITHDGGKNWKIMAYGEGPGYRSQIVFIPGSNGHELLAVGSEGISYSSDQGDTWKQLSTDSFYTVKMISNTEGFLAGKDKIAFLSLKRNPLQ